MCREIVMKLIRKNDSRHYFRDEPEMKLRNAITGKFIVKQFLTDLSPQSSWIKDKIQRDLIVINSNLPAPSFLYSSAKWTVIWSHDSVANTARWALDISSFLCTRLNFSNVKINVKHKSNFKCKSFSWELSQMKRTLHLKEYGFVEQCTKSRR